MIKPVGRKVSQQSQQEETLGLPTEGQRHSYFSVRIRAFLAISPPVSELIGQNRHSSHSTPLSEAQKIETSTHHLGEHWGCGIGLGCYGWRTRG